MPTSIAGLASKSRPAEALSLDGAFSMDNDAFAAFYQRSARPLWAYLARVSGDPSLADDLMQEAYVRFLGIDHPPLMEEGEVAQRRYLFRIATNLLRDYWRKPRTSSIEDLPESFFAASSHAGQHETQALLTPALAKMNPRERQLLWLAHAEGYSHREIAQIMGLASASIRLLLFRARRKMAAYLREPATHASHAAQASLPASPLRRQP
jgi:RNA polymerase sigma-70 factor (ECF subfamily)